MKKGNVISEESRQKMSEAAHKRYANGFVNPRKGIKLSDELKLKLSEIAKEGFRNGRTRIGIGLGIKKSEETKLKISIAKKGQQPWNKGLKLKPHSDEHKKRISIGNKINGHVPPSQKGQDSI